MKINVIGTTGSGKSTLSKRLASELRIPFVELDSLFWREGWKGISHEELCASLKEALSGPSWVVDGNYKKTEFIKWRLAGDNGGVQPSENETRVGGDRINDEPLASATAVGSELRKGGGGEDKDEEVVVAWVDFGFWRTLWQATCRAISRIWFKTKLWDCGNVETFRQTFLSRDSILWFTVTTYSKNRERNEELMRLKAAGAPEYRHVRFFRLQSSAEIDAFVAQMSQEHAAKMKRMGNE